jgi:hypothetical protein
MKSVNTLIRKKLHKKTPIVLFLFFTCFIGNAQITGTAVNVLKEPVAFRY